MFDTKENLAKNARNNAEIQTRHKFIYTVELENKINLCMYLPHLLAESGLPLATTSHLLFTFISHFAAELLLVYIAFLFVVPGVDFCIVSCIFGKMFLCVKPLIDSLVHVF